jgi:bisphosphoglycerate-dependent phosphoglycerate mutase
VYAGAILALLSYGSFKGVKKAQSTANQAKQFRELSRKLKSENPQSSGDIKALNDLYASRLAREETWAKAVNEYLKHVAARVNTVYVSGNFGEQAKNTPLVLSVNGNNIGLLDFILDNEEYLPPDSPYEDHVDLWANGSEYWWA